MKKIVLPDFGRRGKPRVLNQLLYLTELQQVCPKQDLCVHFVLELQCWIFSYNVHSRRTHPVKLKCAQASQLMGQAQEWRKLKKQGRKKTAVFSKSVMFAWEILQYRNILHVAWHALTPELCLVVFQLSFTLLLILSQSKITAVLGRL